MLKVFYVDKLKVNICESRSKMGESAAITAGDKIKELLAKKDEINIIFAAAPSQNELLKTLTELDGIDWARVNAFHMDEYIGLPAEAPQGFGNFLKERLFSKLPFKSVSYLNGGATNIEAECKCYSALLAKNPPDIVFMGVGENGHIAFNDPPVADFNDTSMVKIVKLDEICRNQQVNDGCFSSIDLVPTHAMTLTIPTLFGADYLFCVVCSRRNKV